MAETSFPVVEQPLSAEQWKSVTLGIGSGVLDEGGNPYRLNSLDNASNTGMIRCDRNKPYAHAILSGFYHKIDSDVRISLPAVSTVTTYYVVLQYDPARSTSPVELKVVTGLDYSQGKTYVVLHRVVRRPNELLTDAAVLSMKPKVAPCIVVDTPDLLPSAENTLWGTVAFVSHPTFQIFRAGVDAVGDDPGDLRWYSQTDPDWVEYADTAAYKWPGTGGRRGIQRIGKKRHLKGRIARVGDADFNSGNPSGYLMMTLPAGDWPVETRSYVTDTSLTSNPGHAKVQVSGTTGEVRAWVSSNCKWVSLDGITFDAR